MLHQTLTFIILVNLFRLRTVTSAKDANRLFEDLLGNYNKLARPIRNNTESVEIQFKLKLLQILDVHEKQQIMSINGWLIHIWNDYRLEWKPYEYGNVTVLHIPAELIWLPDIILYNNANGSPQVTTITKAHVYFTGKVVWEPPVIYNSMCEIDIEWFPFDQQFCEMKFGSWTYYGSQLDMDHLTGDVVVEAETKAGKEWTVMLGVDIAEFQESVEWDLMSVLGTKHKKWYPCCDYPYVDITYYLNIRRKTLFYTVNLIIPCVGIAMLTSLVFYIPSDSNNKISLCVSVLVALTVFFLLLIEIIPPTSLAVPLIGRYLLFTMVLVSLSVSLSVIGLNIHYRSPNLFPMPRWVRKVFLHWVPKLMFMERPNDLSSKDEPLEKDNKPDVVSNLRGPKGKPLLSAHSMDDKLPGENGTKSRTAASMFSNCKRPMEADLDQYLRSSTTTMAQFIERYKQRACYNICYIAQQLKQREAENNLREDWKYVAMVVDRIFLCIFSFIVVFGSCFIILSAPMLSDTRTPITQKYKQLMESMQ